jgi:pimeloyl-ACP methyl ester carboxylesterase
VGDNGAQAIWRLTASVDGTTGRITSSGVTGSIAAALGTDSEGIAYQASTGRVFVADTPAPKHVAARLCTLSHTRNRHANHPLRTRGRPRSPDGRCRIMTPDSLAAAAGDRRVATHVGAIALADCEWAAGRVRGVLIMNAPLGPSLGGHLFEVAGTRWFGSTVFWGDGVARSMFSPATRRVHPERIREFVAAFPSFDRRAAATTVQTVLTRFPGLEAVLPRLAVPTTILMGAEDRLYPVERMRPFVRLAPAATLEIVPACGHLAPLEAPEAVVAALRGLATADASWGPASRRAPEMRP